MASIIRTSAAETDLAEIWSYIAADNPRAADELLARIDAAFSLIGDMPEIGFSIEGIQPGIRCKPVKRNCLVFYQIIDDEAFILRILHGARKHEEFL